MNTKQINSKRSLLTKCYKTAKAIIEADKMILNNIDRPSKDHRVNLHFWDSSIEIGDKCQYNLGDNLSPIVVEFMLNKRGLSLQDEIDSKQHLYAIGSIISMGYQDATIWGSGFLEPLSWIRKIFLKRPFRKLDVRAVRGPESRRVLLDAGQDCPEVYGDPGMLLPLMYKPAIDKERDYIIIPHFTKEEEYRKTFGDNHIVSMMTNDYKSLVDKICSSKLVISGSLHGIIISEAYGVPTIFLRDREAYKDFKYNDYYASTNRKNYRYASSIQEALRLEPTPLPKNIKELQDGLVASFPYDLWDK